MNNEKSKYQDHIKKIILDLDDDSKPYEIWKIEAAQPKREEASVYEKKIDKHSYVILPDPVNYNGLAFFDTVILLVD